MELVNLLMQPQNLRDAIVLVIAEQMAQATEEPGEAYAIGYAQELYPLIQHYAGLHYQLPKFLAQLSIQSDPLQSDLEKLTSVLDMIRVLPPEIARAYWENDPAARAARSSQATRRHAEALIRTRKFQAQARNWPGGDHSLSDCFRRQVQLTLAEVEAGLEARSQAPASPPHANAAAFHDWCITELERQIAELTEAVSLRAETINEAFELALSMASLAGPYNS